jgi:nucleoside recognition membrane protein YjiH
LVPFTILLSLLSHLITVSFGFTWQTNNLQVTWTLGVVSVLGNWFTAATIFYLGQLLTVLSNYKPDFDFIRLRNLQLPQ